MGTQNIYKLVGLKENPFHLSPDPRYFYYTPEHEDVLQRLYLSIDEKRGLNIIYGDYGTGKTTMAEIIQDQYGSKKDYILAKIATPRARSEFQFYKQILSIFNIKAKSRSTLEYRSALETFTFEKNIAEGKSIILIVDEGESLLSNQISILRTLLNFETPEQKFLQLIIFAQLELIPKVKKKESFVDRISLSYVLNPLNKEQTVRLIEHRLKVAGWDGKNQLFSEDALDLIYRFSKGFPRYITKLCGSCLTDVLIGGSQRITKENVKKHGEQETRLYGERKVRKI